MSSYSIEIDDSDLEEAVNREIPSAINGVVREALEEGAQEIFDAARSKVPIDTGALFDSISQNVSDTEFTVQATEDYAGFVEFGTVKMAAQPYFYDTANQVAKNISTVIESKLNQKLPD